MKNVKHSLLKTSFIFSSLIFSALTFPLVGQETENSTPSSDSAANSSEPEFSTEDQEFLTKLNQACEKAVQQFVKENSLQSPKNQRERARIESKNLLYNLSRYPDSKKGKSWIKFLLLDELLESFAQEEQDLAPLEKSISRFEYDAAGLDSPDFIRVRDVLKSYRRALKYQRSEDIKTDFTLECQSIQEAAKRYLTYGPSNASDVEIITNALEALDEFQPKSQNVQEIKNILNDRFGTPNFRIEFGSNFLPKDGIAVTKPVKVQEVIRGTNTYGNGTMTGTVTPQFIPNSENAEIKINLRASLNTNTVGYNRGVTVQTANTGNIALAKSIFIAEKLRLGKTASGIQSNSVITGLDTGRGPVGSQFVYDRINTEFPYSKAESENLMRTRAIAQFDEEINQQTVKANEQLDKFNAFLKEINFSPRHIQANTTESRLYWSVLLGNPLQLGPAKTEELSQEYDYVIRIHESIFNNLFYTALAGRRISEEEMFKLIQKHFPDVIPGMAAIHPETSSAADSLTKSDDPNVSSEGNLFITFFETLPISVQMDNQMVRVQSHIDLFEEDGKNLPGLDIDVTYTLEQRGDEFFFIQKEVEAWPPELDRSAMIPARYQVIRNQILKRLKAQLPAETKIPSIRIPEELNEKSLSIMPPSKDEEEVKTRGTLAASEVIIKDGWFILGGNFAEDAKPETDSASQSAEASQAAQ